MPEEKFNEIQPDSSFYEPAAVQQTLQYSSCGAKKRTLENTIMEMIIAELHEQSKNLRYRARIALLAAKQLQDYRSVTLSVKDEAAVKALYSNKGLAKELSALRLLAVELKMSVRDNSMSYPTPAALHRRLSRACEVSAVAIEAEARLLSITDGDCKMYRALMSESAAFRLEAEAHMDSANDFEQSLSDGVSKPGRGK